ncbi:MAG: CoB--CoM heterodisulfide reductase iron-sulfur subunit A family protein [Candidatus Helarchaeota archaeon]|nr:CoB--CoM heterodisulfide reductase iron-sulfur subunit A family protein [Candidatus Helarchaeota archaeon]
MSKLGSVLVVGGGIAGMQASLDLANSGFKVYILEKLTAIGGIMSQLDKTFPTNDCAMCIMAPKLVSTGRHHNIEVITYSEIQKVEGEAGNFEVTILQKPRYIDTTKCTGCASCELICPIEVINDYDAGLRERSCIYVRYPQAIPKVSAIDKDFCLGCGLCSQLCEAEAIDYTQSEKELKLNVGSIILAIGAEPTDPKIKKSYGYGRLPNVLTSLEFERLLSASGPFDGHVLKPSDGMPPKKIAWLNCLGSRDESIGKNYCSSVCCMYSVKEAIIAREHDPNIEPHIFFMDMRAFGKGFEKYYVNAGKINGVKFTRARVSQIKQHGDALQIRFEDENGDIIDENFDMIVLSIGFSCPEEYKKLEEIFGVKLNEYNFIDTGTFAPLRTSKEGIFVCGTLKSPKDIPDTVAEASGAAAEASSLLATQRNTLTVQKEYPPETDISEEEPRVGVFICHCGINIGAVVNVPEVVEFAKTLPNVVHAERNLYTCSPDTQEKIKKIIKEKNINRVVVASCSPRTHEPLFQNTIREAGLNFYLFSMANIREHCSWVHRSDPVGATAKAKYLVAMAAGKAALQEPIYNVYVKMTQSGIVIGGGIAGMTAALEIARQGFQAYLIEKSSELGGLVNKIKYLADGTSPASCIELLKNQLNSNEKIKVFLDAKIDEIGGSVGSFSATVTSRGETEQIEAGIIIVATGGTEYLPTEYNYGKDERVLTQSELEERIFNKDLKNIKNVVMIQCVGSRCEERNYCSRVCCAEALKNAIALKEADSGINVYILNKDIRSYGFREFLYRRARELGVKFIRFDDENEPVLEHKDSKLVLYIKDKILGRKLALKPGLLILSSAILPNIDKDLNTQLKIPLDENEFFLEAHMKLRPLDFANDGIFLCGLAHSPKFIDETIAQAKGAVSRACTFLSKEEIELEGIYARVDQEKCLGCGLCESVCPYEAMALEKTEAGKRANNNKANCKGCGTCASSCPQRAISMPHFTDGEIISQVKMGLISNG